MAGVSSEGTNNTFDVNVKLTATQGIGQSVAGSFTVNSEIDLNGNDLGISTANGSGTTLLAGSITGSGNVSTGGSGTTALAASNDYDGVTTVNAGTLAVRHAEALGTAASGTELAGNAALQLRGEHAVDAISASVFRESELRFQSIRRGIRKWGAHRVCDNSPLFLGVSWT